MGMGFAPTWLRQVSPLLHKTTLITDYLFEVSPDLHQLLLQLNHITYFSFLYARYCMQPRIL